MKTPQLANGNRVPSGKQGLRVAGAPSEGGRRGPIFARVVWWLGPSLFWSFSFSSDPVRAGEIYVPSDYPTIGAALAVAVGGDNVWVEPGTYLEHSLSPPAGVALRSTSGPDVTVIDANSLGRVFELNAGVIIQGFTIQNGYSLDGGGGIRAIGGAPVLLGNRIINSTTLGAGGGVQVVGSTYVSIRHGMIADNVAAEGGGGIHLHQVTGSGAIEELQISRNYTASSGGGILLSNCSARLRIESATVSENESSGDGGGVSVDACEDASVVSSSLDDNIAGGRGGGLASNRDVLVSNGNIRRNRAVVGGGGLGFLFNPEYDTVSIRENLIASNTSSNPGQCSSAADPGCGRGGAIWVEQLTEDGFNWNVTGNVMCSNRADRFGTALFFGPGGAMGPAANFARNLVLRNTSRFGVAGVGCVGLKSCRVIGNRFLNNHNDAQTSDAGLNAGAVFMSDAGYIQVDDNFFYRNRGFEAGAIMLSDPSLGGPDAQILNNSFVDNESLSNAGGTVWIESGSFVANNILQGDGLAIRGLGNASIFVDTNSFFGVPVLFSQGGAYQDVGVLNAQGFASGNIEVAPGFIWSGSYLLRSDSSLIDAGRCDIAEARDIDRDLRPLGSGCEIGADEFNLANQEIFRSGFGATLSDWSDVQN